MLRSELLCLCAYADKVGVIVLFFMNIIIFANTDVTNETNESKICICHAGFLLLCMLFSRLASCCSSAYCFLDWLPVTVHVVFLDWLPVAVHLVF